MSENRVLVWSVVESMVCFYFGMLDFVFVVWFRMFNYVWGNFWDE